ncbi:MAG: DUF429 domain-containing protein [Gaiellaceae bacterium]
MKTVGVDAARGGWLAVVVDDRGFQDAWLAPDLDVVVARCAAADSIVVDVPIGLPPLGERRRADAAARALVGVRRSSIFWAPPRAALAAATYAEARLVDPTLSAQAFALKRAILDAEQQGSRVQEGHPEASFRALAGSPLRYAKRTWNGQMLRRQLLATAGIQLSDDLLEAGLVPPDDVLDAAAMAWTARRVAAGISETLPADPTHTEPVIRY